MRRFIFELSYLGGYKCLVKARDFPAAIADDAREICVRMAGVVND